MHLKRIDKYKLKLGLLKSILVKNKFITKFINTKDHVSNEEKRKLKLNTKTTETCFPL